ncbi:protein phosphatase 1K, mitochondrial isoform X2 [Tetranychus urticae]|nr:protein phosphatase 1K, mitochondrial isoform X2 [Tetranychus urticae]
MAGSASVIGRRTTNEDRIRIKELRPDLIYLAIFDGHGGSLAADFCSQQMELYISYWLRRGETDLEAVLQNAFIEVNNALARYISLKVKDKDSMFSGTTATVCLLKDSIELTIANVGDSRALLCRNGDARKLTIDHSPSLKSEKERIIKSGGTIIANSHGIGLVNGRLAMTRSIGDLDLKPYGVIALPYTRSLKIEHGKDAFLVMTTDGVSFVMNDQEIVDAGGRCTSPAEAANFIAEQALHYACDDNASTIVIPFGAWGKILHNRNVNYSSFGRELCRSNRH